MEKLEKIFINIIIACLIVIAIILIYNFFQLNILNKEYTNIFGYTYFQVETGSMEDTIKIEDIVIIKLNDEIGINDIITFKQNDAFITHRVIKIDDEKLITKGDNNNANDEPISKNDVIGKVVYIVQDVGVWKKVFSDIQVIIPMTITIIIFIILICYKEKVKQEQR